MLWLAGILFFYLPLAAVVIVLSRAIPVEGGTYRWVKTGISPFAGYLAAWNVSFFAIVIIGVHGPMVINSLAYIAGPGSAWMMSSSLFAVALIGKRSLGFRPDIGVRLAALSGFVVCVASLPLQVVPLAGVPNSAVFGLKVSGLVCLINALGALVLLARKEAHALVREFTCRLVRRGTQDA